jgi:hypothetical protein
LTPLSACTSHNEMPMLLRCCSYTTMLQ